MNISRKHIKKYLLAIVTLAILVSVSYLFSFFQGWVNVDSRGIVSSSKLPKKTLTPSYMAKLTIDSMPVSHINDVSIKVFGNEFSCDDIYMRALRYYVPLDKFSKTLGFNFHDSKDSITISKGDKIISLNKTNNTASIEQLEVPLRGNILPIKDKAYLSISDIENLFNLTTNFNFKQRTINFVENPIVQPSSGEDIAGRAALIRLEDFGPSVFMQQEEIQEKFKVFADFLGSQKIKFHIAWVPRYVEPESNIDNDLLCNNSMGNIGFINMMDKLILRGAEVGLHGYTHQFGDETSFSGTEFSKNANSDEKSTRELLEKAIDTASALNIPVDFFESPHYKATKKQLKIIQEYFQYVYQPSSIINFTTLKLSGDNLYFPTPLSYVKDLEVKPILKGIKHPLPYQLTSLYYHPTKELDFIHVSFSDKDMTYSYDDNGPMKQIVKALSENGFRTVHVTDFKPKN